MYLPLGRGPYRLFQTNIFFIKVNYYFGMHFALLNTVADSFTYTALLISPENTSDGYNA